MTFLIAHFPEPFSPSRYHSQTDEERFLSESTTPTYPYARVGLCAGRSSSVICCSPPRSSSCTWRRRRRPHTCSLCPYLPPSSSSPFTPSLTMLGVPHVLVTMVSMPRCHQ